MPELPEVETLCRELEKAIKGRIIKSVEVNWPKMVKPLSPKNFRERLKNQKIAGVTRRAKVLILKLSGGGYLLIHLKLTGQLIYQENKKPRNKKSAPTPSANSGRFSPELASPPYKGGEITVAGGHPLSRRFSEASPQEGGAISLPNKFTHIIVAFKDGSLLFFNDLRKFGWMRLVGKSELDALQSEYGVEPLSQKFTLGKFKEILGRYPNRKIKQILLDQSLIAGVGNIYADESCFRAGILPARIAKSIKTAELKKLHQGLKDILKLSIAKHGTSTDTYRQLDGRPGGFVPYLKVYGRKGERCKRCKSVIKRTKLNGRGTHFCDTCQK